METTETPTCCSNPGCDQSGSSKCSACKTTPYCGPICQTAHWAHHKESCEGHLLKVGSAHLAKAVTFFVADNFVLTLRHSDLALAKFNAMKKRPLEAISEALAYKCESLGFLDRDTESLQCAKDKYNLWAMARGPAHPKTIDAAFLLIDCLIQNHEYEDAHLFAHTLWEIIHTNNHRDNDIPGEERVVYVAKAADLLAQAIYRWAEIGGIPPEEQQKSGEEAIARARQSLEIYTQEDGFDSERAAIAMCVLADVLDYFSDSCDDEALRLYQQSIVIGHRVEGSTSMDVGVREANFGAAYCNRAEKARAANDLDREQSNLELALPHYREAVRIDRANKNMDAAESIRIIAEVEERLRQLGIARAAAPAVRG